MASEGGSGLPTCNVQVLWPFLLVAGMLVLTQMHHLALGMNSEGDLSGTGSTTSKKITSSKDMETNKKTSFPEIIIEKATDSPTGTEVKPKIALTDRNVVAKGSDSNGKKQSRKFSEHNRQLSMEDLTEIEKRAKEAGISFEGQKRNNAEDPLERETKRNDVKKQLSTEYRLKEIKKPSEIENNGNKGAPREEEPTRQLQLKEEKVIKSLDKSLKVKEHSKHLGQLERENDTKKLQGLNRKSLFNDVNEDFEKLENREVQN